MNLTWTLILDNKCKQLHQLTLEKKKKKVVKSENQV